MQTGYYVNTGAMVTAFNNLNVISNNLANVNTNGYKSDDTIIGDFERLFKENRDVLPLKNNTKEAAKFINRTLNKIPHIVEEYTDFKIGNIQQTSNPLDLALKRENAFFKIETPNGIKYSRDGAFLLDDKGFLVTKDGYKVLDNKNQPIQLSPEFKININQNGDIYQNHTKLTTLAISKFDNLKLLKKVGDNLFQTDQQPIQNNQNNVMQGYLEKSNINVVREMTKLIETNRLVEMYQKVATTHMDDLNSDAINKLGNVRA